MTSLRLVLSLALALAGCSSELDNKPAATVTEAAPAAGAQKTSAKPKGPPPPPPPPVPTTVPEGAWRLAADSEINWVGAKITRDHTGGFKVLRGHATVTDGKVVGGTVEIPISGLFSDSPKLSRHLRSPDFFDAAAFPKAVFTLTKVTADQVTGTLSLHGVDKELSFPATVVQGEKDLRITASFTLLRKDFGIVYPGKPEDLIRDEVLVKGTLHFSD